MSSCAGVSQGRFQEWQALERQTLEAEREKIRRSAITQSRSVLGGKFTEQIAPYLPDFKYDPTEARFIGTPFDLIIFPGLATGDPQEIVIMEIKTGKNPQLSPVERKIRQLNRGRHGALRVLPAAGERPPRRGVLCAGVVFSMTQARIFLQARRFSGNECPPAGRARRGIRYSFL